MMPTSRMSHFLVLLLLPALAAVPEQPAEPIAIQAGTLGIEPDWLPGVAEWIEQQAKEFAAAHPGIKVDLIGLDAPSRNSLPIEENALLARNVVGIDSVSGYEAAWLAARGDIVALESFQPDPGFRKEDFFDNLWPPVVFDGKTWAVPFVVAPLVFAYRTDIFNAARIGGPPETWEALAQCLAELAAAEGLPEEICQLHVDDVAQTALTMLVQQGALMRDGQFAPEISHIARALSVVEAIERNRRETFQYGRQDLGQAAMVVGSPGTLNEIPRASRAKFRIAPLPSWEKDVQFPYQAIYLAVRSASPEYEKASWEFVKWLTRAGAPAPVAPAAMFCRKSPLEQQNSQFQEPHRLGESLPKMVDYGPNNLMGRRRRLDEVASAIERAFGSGDGLNLTQFEQELGEINGRLAPIAPPSRAPYALYR